MNKLLWPTGGVQLHSEDFIFAETAVRDAIGGLVSKFQEGNTVLVISGCEVSFAGSNASITEGWVVINNEILFMPAQTVSTNVGGSVQLGVNAQVHVFNDSAGLETLASSASGNTYQVRQARILGGVSNTAYDYKNWVRLEDKLADLCVSATDVLNINSNDLEAGFTLVSNAPATIEKSLGKLYFRGQIQTPNNLTLGADNLVVTLPVEFRPSTNMLIPVTAISGSSYVMAFMTVTTSGGLYIWPVGSQISRFVMQGVAW
jgi:hypothetical protein